MAALAVTAREPVGDIRAQFRCLYDAEHPRAAVWVSVGTALPAELVWGGEVLVLDAGTLYAWERAVIDRLRADPSEEGLGRILGYVEAKPGVVGGELPVVQALDGAGGNSWVVWEQLASWGRVGWARAAARLHAWPADTVRVVSMAACLARRQRLIAVEVGDAEVDA